jgi:antirestriction protein ArdC
MAVSTTRVEFSDLLQQAVTTPGVLSAAYSQFHNYSLGNVLLAAFQCAHRGIPLGPMATFNRWKELGRHVRKGERAITLCQPVTVRTKGETTDTDQPEAVIVRFMFRNRWFVLAQTEGESVAPLPVADWDRERAMATLGVMEIPFTAANGNAMGYATGRQVAISPLNPFPLKTLFHELAHVLLGHTAEADQADTEAIPRSLREVEAEAVALLCCEALKLPGAEHCRGYIQAWWGEGNTIPEKSAQRVLRVADQVLKAGRDQADGDNQ